MWGPVSMHRDPAPGSWVGHPTSTRTTEAVTSQRFRIGETEKQRVILTALTWQYKNASSTDALLIYPSPAQNVLAIKRQALLESFYPATF